MKDNRVIIAIVVSALFICTTIYFTRSSSVVDRDTKQNVPDSSKMIALYNRMRSTLPDHEMYCIPETKSECGSQGCKSLEPSVFTLISESPKQVSISRCDDKPCDTYEAKARKSGMYLSVDTVEPHGMLFKTSIPDGSYVEVVTLGTDTLVSNGHCYNAK